MLQDTFCYQEEEAAARKKQAAQRVLNVFGERSVYVARHLLLPGGGSRGTKEAGSAQGAERVGERSVYVVRCLLLAGG